MRIAIVGGGIIGLSLAYELSSRGHDIELLDQGPLGGQASWAGAGMLPPANSATALHPIEHLMALSNRLHSHWSRSLREQTGIDDQYTCQGSLHLARTPGEVASLFGAIDEWDTQQIRYEKWELTETETASRLPFLGTACRQQKSMAVYLPDAAQFHNPRRIQALEQACRKARVAFRLEQPNVGLRLNSTQASCLEVVAGNETINADQIIIAAGPWTEVLVSDVGVSLPMQPVRGQMVQYQVQPESHAELLAGILINEGTRYLVPRRDGVVLAGSSIEEVGFDDRTTEAELKEIRQWAQQIVPALDDNAFVQGWAGLRPATFDGFPYLGRLPGIRNGWVATGHFKMGLQLSTGTAVVLADAIEGKPASVDLTPFRPDRVLE